MTTKRIDYAEPKAAFLRLKSWAGILRNRCEVIGETAQRYRIRATEAVRLPGRRFLDPGDVTLVPKTAIEFYDDWLVADE